MLCGGAKRDTRLTVQEFKLMGCTCSKCASFNFTTIEIQFSHITTLFKKSNSSNKINKLVNVTRR